MWKDSTFFLLLLVAALIVRDWECLKVKSPVLLNRFYLKISLSPGQCGLTRVVHTPKGVGLIPCRVSCGRQPVSVSHTDVSLFPFITLVFSCLLFVIWPMWIEIQYWHTWITICLGHLKRYTAKASSYKVWHLWHCFRWFFTRARKTWNDDDGIRCTDSFAYMFEKVTIPNSHSHRIFNQCF